MSVCGDCGFEHGWLHGCPPPALVRRARAYIAASEWIFAKTMPDNPHWYVVRKRSWAKSKELGEGHEALYELIRWFYRLRWWHLRGYRSLELDGWVYWLIQDGTIINRKPVDKAGWDEFDEEPADGR
jgi:hypothetical protein